MRNRLYRPTQKTNILLSGEDTATRLTTPQGTNAALLHNGAHIDKYMNYEESNIKKKISHANEI